MHNYDGHISRYERYERSRPNSPPVRSHHRSERFESRDHHGSKHDGYSKQGAYQDAHHVNRDYKAKWLAPSSRYEHSRSRSPQPRYHRLGGEAGNVNSSLGDTSDMAGLIFMCNKKTQRRCLAYNVLGMPMARKYLADRIVPGMKLFLFEFESRQMHGIFEAVTYAEMDLEPKAFVDAGIQFPLQVRFRVLEKCLPLREPHFKDAILANYFEPNRFRFELTKSQVFRLIDLFATPNPVQRSFDAPRKMHVSPPRARSSFPDDIRRSTHDYKSYSSARAYTRRDGHESEFISKKPVYYDNHRSPQRAITGHRQLDYPAGPESSNIGYDSDYRLARVDTPSKRRYDPDGWQPNEYGYNDNVPPNSTSFHQAATQTPAYSTIPSKYDSVSVGYTIGRAELPVLPPNEPDRYWKPDDTPLQLPPDSYAIKPSLYGRQGMPVYGDAGGHRPCNMEPAVEDASLRLPVKKTLVDLDYLPIATTSELAYPPLQVGQTLGVGKELKYDTVSGYSSDIRRLPLGYAENGMDPLLKQPARYGYSSSLPAMREDAAYPAGAILTMPSLPDNGTSYGDRLARELSPRYPVVELASYRPVSYYKAAERTGEIEEQHRQARMNGERPYEVHHPTKADYRHMVPKYVNDQSPDRGGYRKASVWDRVSGISGPRGVRGREYEYKSNGSYTFGSKRPREFSQEPDYHPADGEASFPFDFKRRQKGNDISGSTLPRKRRFVRPDAQYSDRSKRLQS